MSVLVQLINSEKGHINNSPLTQCPVQWKFIRSTFQFNRPKLSVKSTLIL